MKFINLIDDFEQEIIKSTQEVIKIKSVEEKPLPGMPFGEGPYRALKYTLELGEQMGFETKNFDGYAGHIDFGNGDEIVGVLAHLDVVPEGEGWSFDPYSGEIHNGKIYGRGTTDDKGPAIATLYAMKALRDSGVKVNKKIRLILGTNEETGWGCMEHYFKNEKSPDMAFTPDAEFPVIHGEKGVMVFDFECKLNKQNESDIIVRDVKGGSAPNMVPDHAEAILEVPDFDLLMENYSRYIDGRDYPVKIYKEDNLIKVLAKGKSAHGSTPEKGENAITYLMDFLGVIFNGESSFGKFIEIYNNRLAFDHNGEKIGCGFSDDISGKLNFNIGMIKFEDEKIVLTINVRYPIKSCADEVYKGIRENLKGTQLAVVEGHTDMKPLYVPKDDFLVEKLMKVYREQTGDFDSEPITIGGGTYARAMKNAVAFGAMFPGQEERAHQKDEYIGIDHLMKITKIYAHALYELAK